jgi:hypothetical protein
MAVHKANGRHIEHQIFEKYGIRATAGEPENIPGTTDGTACRHPPLRRKNLFAVYSLFYNFAGSNRTGCKGSLEYTVHFSSPDNN